MYVWILEFYVRNILRQPLFKGSSSKSESNGEIEREGMDACFVPEISIYPSIRAMTRVPRLARSFERLIRWDQIT